MATFFRPRTSDTQPRFVRSITSAEFQEGFLLGYLCNFRNYNTVGLDGCRTNGVLITALSSTVDPRVSPDFAYPTIRTGMRNIVDLHKKTLWLGGGKISDSSGRLFNEAKSIGLNLKCSVKSAHSFSCAQYVEELILRWGFAAVKDPVQSTMYIYPLFLGIDLSGDTPAEPDRWQDGCGVVLGGNGDSPEDVWGRISEGFGDNNDILSDEFRKGFFHGINC